MKKKRLLILGVFFIACQLSLKFLSQYFQYDHRKSKTYNLTSLMIPFEYMNRNSTFSCSELTLRNRYKLEFEQLEHYHLAQFYDQSSINSLIELPYFYSLWKTSLILPRLITPCEHILYVRLMKIFDTICQNNSIEYFISYGTLLGSYRNHDILPYDDDVDILINMKYYSRLSEINKSNNKTDWKFYINPPSNMKFYFDASPSAGKYTWKWPFIGIDFYTENSTHIKSNIYIKKDIIFPLVLRPVATLWLPGPRNVQMFFQSISKSYYSNLLIDEKCFQQSYSHRDEKQNYKRKIVNCTQLHNDYQYIHRICDNNYCYEHLMLNNITTLYVLKMNKDK